MHNPKLKNIGLSVEFGGGDPAGFATVLLKHRRLPRFYGFTFCSSASTWLKASSKEADRRRQYEGGAWKGLKLHNLFDSDTSDVLGVVGLAVGDGLGEVELLREMLAEGRTVHYVAVDLSPILLVTHVEMVREVFDKELKEGRLLCMGVMGDVFENLGDTISAARSEFARKGVIEKHDDFLPVGSQVLVTYLGNCLGNNSTGCEKKIFSVVSDTFKSQGATVAMLTGISVMRSEPDFYTSAMSDFLLETPRYIHKHLQILRSHRQDSSSEPEEFDISLDANGNCSRLPPVIPTSYISDGIEGQTYTFNYRLAFDLEMPSEKLRLPAETTIELYTITKFRVESVAESLERDGFSVVHDPEYHDCIETEFGTREYAVFAAVMPDRSGK